LPEHARLARGIARSHPITNVFKRFNAKDGAALAVQARSGSSLRFWSQVARERARFDEAEPILREVGFGSRWDDPAAALSHGEQPQLEVALALATQPRLLLLDEPMAGMGSEESERMIELISGLKGRTTILLVEHDMDAAFRLADRISVPVYGRVVASGMPDEIRRNDEVRKAYLGDEADDRVPA
jgi:branched-chain amino acid transport system ATP-binding protein